MSAPTTAEPFSHVQTNLDMHLNDYTTYGTKKYVPFSTIIRYGTNKALIFYVLASTYSGYILATSNQSNNQKYIYFAVSLYLTQMIYNYLDINDDSNLTRLNLSIQP